LPHPTYEAYFQPRPVPLQRLSDPILDAHGVALTLKREDQVHPGMSGNKFWKLKYNVKAALDAGHTTLLTFGGAYSNHIHAVAMVGHALGLKTIGIIRGECHQALNPVLAAAHQHGMQLAYLDRSTYRQKHSDEVMAALTQTWGRFYCLPEGGSNALAIQGTREILLPVTPSFDVVCCACGTGGTLAGLIAALSPQQQALGVSVLKGGGFLQAQIARWLAEIGVESSRWSLALQYHWGGFAKHKPELLAFIDTFKQQHGIPLEPVYTGKMMYAVYDMIQQGYFPVGTRVLALHTGGVNLTQA